MKIGVNLNCYSDELSIEKQIYLMKSNGFETTFCMESIENIDDIIAKVQGEGIIFETLHSPLHRINDMWSPDPSDNSMLERLFKSVERCSDFEIPTLVVHLSAGRPAPLINDCGNARYDALMEYARKYGVKIAYENSRCVGNIAAALERYDDALFCWDIGHENCFTPGMKFLPYFADRVGAVHIHDNMCILDKDIHIIPFDGKIDMDSIARELAQSSYNKSIMLELERRFSNLYDSCTPEEYYKKAADAARKFAQKVKDSRVLL